MSNQISFESYYPVSFVRPILKNLVRRDTIEKVCTSFWYRLFKAIICFHNLLNNQFFFTPVFQFKQQNYNTKLLSNCNPQGFVNYIYIQNTNIKDLRLIYLRTKLNMVIIPLCRLAMNT